MSRLWLILCLSHGLAHGQSSEAVTLEEDIRDRSAAGEEAGDPVDEGLSWDRGFHLRRKLPLNIIEPATLGELLGLTSLQVEAFGAYRRRLGPFIDPLELQSIPGWDEATVRRVLPWVQVDEERPLTDLLRMRARSGSHTLLLRAGLTSADIGAKAAAARGGTPHAGGPSHVLFRYGYRYGSLMQGGLTVEKDAGEKLPGRAGLPLADFVSGHLAIREWRRVRVLVIGDYQANLGQGLTHWQGMAFRKTADAMTVLRQGPALRPYSGTDENRFHRGGALEWTKGGWRVAAFLSARRLDAHREDDSLGRREAYVSSLLTSGLHRTDGEREDRHALGMRAVGGRVSFETRGAVVGLNAVAGRFGIPIRKDPVPYNLHAFTGTDWSNLSFDFGVPVRNARFFGEFAMDGGGGLSCLQGFLASVHPRLDLAWLFRAIQPRYRSLQANAFTEQSEPGNETGTYAGLCLRLPGGWKADAWMDTYRFPWLRYRVDRPSSGSGFLVNLAWTPDRRTEAVLRWQRESRGSNEPGASGAMHAVMPMTRSGFRWQATFRPGPEWMVRSRVEGSRYRLGEVVEEGFLCHFDLQCRPVRSPWRIMGRITLYDTEGYSSRIYGFENDVPFRSAMSVYHGRGLRGYLVMGWRGGGPWSLSAKLGTLVREEGGDDGRIDFRLQAILTLAGRGGTAEE